MPSLNHSYLCAQIMHQLWQNSELLPLPELTLNIERGVTPDISVYPASRIKPNFFHDVARYDEMPLLAIEIISASQNIQDLLDKAARLIAAGVDEVWTVEPYSRTVFVTDQAQQTHIRHNQIVEGKGIKVDFRRIFEGA